MEQHPLRSPPSQLPGLRPREPGSLGSSWPSRASGSSARSRSTSATRARPGFAHGGAVATALDDTLGTLLRRARPPGRDRPPGGQLPPPGLPGTGCSASRRGSTTSRAARSTCRPRCATATTSSPTPPPCSSWSSAEHFLQTGGVPEDWMKHWWRDGSACPTVAVGDEVRLARAADRAEPVLGHVLERRSGRDPAVGIPDLGVVDHPAALAHPLLEVAVSLMRPPRRRAATTPITFSRRDQRGERVLVGLLGGVAEDLVVSPSLRPAARARRRRSGSARPACPGCAGASAGSLRRLLEVPGAVGDVAVLVARDVLEALDEAGQQVVVSQ